MRSESDQQLDAMLRSHVERCLQDIWETPALEVDDDDDYPFRHGTAVGWVRIQTSEGNAPGVNVFAHAAHDVGKSAKLLAEINDINMRSQFVNVYVRNGTVVVETDVLWTGAGRHALHHALTVVGDCAEAIGPMIAAVFDGSTFYTETVDDGPRAQPSGSDEEAA